MSTKKTNQSIKKQLAESVGAKLKVIEIRKVVGRQILDSRGNPTVEVDITLSSGYP